MKLSTYTAILLLVSVVAITGINAEDDKNNETDTATSKKVINQTPIVIQNIAQHYDQPTLDEYRKCHENLDSCLGVCKTATNKTACELECPTCPILIHQDILVQGINDTDYRVIAATPLNTTNIIRLTNEIHNILNNKVGDISTHNENNIQVHQNVTRTGGRFNLGTNEKGHSCCIVVRNSKSCDQQRFSTAQRCHSKRHRVCGERCTSRVMIAKRITRCTAAQEGHDNCQQSVAYEPYNVRAHAQPEKQQQQQQLKCHSLQVWPYVACRQPQQENQINCQRCLAMPYGRILQYGIPQPCAPCFSSGSSWYSMPQQSWYAPPPSSYYTPYMYPGSYATAQAAPPAAQSGNNFVWDEEEFLPGGSDGWTVEKTKCRRADGTIIENCDENISHNDKHPSLKNNTNDNNVWGSGDDANFIDNSIDENTDRDFDLDSVDDNVEEFRHRRQAFRRSSYSHRYKDV